MKPVVEHFTGERISNPNPTGDVSWQLYHTVRNAVVRCCNGFGTAGPMGEAPIGTQEDIPLTGWDVADSPCDFYIIDGQYNHERYVYLELLAEHTFTEAWVLAMMQTLREFPGWGAGVNAFPPDGYVLIFADKLFVKGKLFEQCGDLPCVVDRGAKAIGEYLRSRRAR